MKNEGTQLNGPFTRLFAGRMSILSFAFLILSLVARAQDKEQVSRDLIEMEQNRSKAIAAHDSISLDKMYAEEFTGVNALGYSVSKRDLMALFRRDNPSTVFTNDNHQVTILTNDVATLTGRLTGRDRDGKIISQSLYIHVLIKRDGRWQIIKGQGTNLPLNQ